MCNENKRKLKGLLVNERVNEVKNRKLMTHGLVVLTDDRMGSFSFQVYGLTEGCIGPGMTAIESVVV